MPLSYVRRLVYKLRVPGESWFGIRDRGQHRVSHSNPFILYEEGYLEEDNIL